jgi:two-component system chemotaxis response regulator CheY
MKVLIADDSVTAARSLAAVLEQAGAQVVGHARSGTEALRLYTETKPDLVFLDIVMPQMDGLSALRSLRALDQGAKVVILSSAVGVGSNVEAALRLGALAIVTKPFSPEQIVSALHKHS